MLKPLKHPIKINLLYSRIDPATKENSVDTRESEGNLIRRVKPCWMRRIASEQPEVMLGCGIRRERHNV